MSHDLLSRLTLAQRLVDENKLSAAETELLHILGHEKENTRALTLLGVVFARTKRFEQADVTLVQVLLANPNSLEAIFWLAIARQEQKQFSSAIELFQRAISLGHRTAETYNNLGLCWLKMEEPVAAGDAFRHAIMLDRSAAQGYFNLGMALKLGGSQYEAFMTFKRAFEIDPSFFGTYIQVWKQMQSLLNWKEGLPILEAGLHRWPESTVMKVAVAATYGKIGLAEKAEAMFTAAVAKDPNARPPFAHWLQEEGRFADSTEVLKEAIRHQPIQGQPYYNLAVAKCLEVDGKSIIDWVKPLLEHPSIGLEGRMFLHYALAKVYDVQKNYELAMGHYDGANERAYKLYNARVNFSAFDLDVAFDRMTTAYSEDAITKLAVHGSKSTAPIFIVGMIRSGTTLLDQILSSHPEVSSAGELPFWQINGPRTDAKGAPYDVSDLANRYLSALQDSAGKATRITDKMPTNFPYLGLISAVFPHSKFIHLRRNPLDTCLSIYTTFLGNSTHFAYNQENIVAYYQAYLRTMEYWRKVLPPNQMIEIDYENLVENKEESIRTVLQFCGLDWNENCMSHEENTSSVSTPSLFTARQPVNTASVGRWRKYEPWLGHLLELATLSHPAVTG